MDWENFYRDLKGLNWVILLVLVSVSYFLMKHAFTTGIIVGGLMVIANFHVFQRSIFQAFSPDGPRRVKKASVIAKFYLRLLTMGVLIYLCITQEWIHPVGLAIGLSIVVISIVVLGIHMIRKSFSEETS